MGQRGRTRSDEFYAELAFEYDYEVGQGNPRPVKTIALRQGLNAMRVRDMLHAARHRGLLTKTRQGRSAGKLTQKGATKLEWIVPNDPLRTEFGAIKLAVDCLDSDVGLNQWITRCERELERLRRRRAPGEDTVLREAATSLEPCRSLGKPRRKRDDIRDLQSLLYDLYIHKANEDRARQLVEKGVPWKKIQGWEIRRLLQRDLREGQRLNEEDRGTSATE